MDWKNAVRGWRETDLFRLLVIFLFVTLDILIGVIAYNTRYSLSSGGSGEDMFTSVYDKWDKQVIFIAHPALVKLFMKSDFDVYPFSIKQLEKETSKEIEHWINDRARAEPNGGAKR